MTRDLRTLIYLLNLELREECSRAGIQLGLQADACNRGAAVEADAIGEQQPKRTPSGAAAEADASGEHAAAAEAGAIIDNIVLGTILSMAQSGSSGRKRRAAAEADAIGEQQLCTQRAVRRRITHGRRTRGK